MFSKFLTRRRFLLKGASVLLASATVGLWSKSIWAQEEPVETMRSLSAYTIQTVGNRTFPLAARRQYATQIVDQRFNTPKLGRLALGTIWRRMNSREREAFLVKFRDLMIEDFVWWFSDYDGQSYRVTGARRDRSNPQVVFVDVEYKQRGQAILTTWRAENEGGIYKVLDIKVAGLSLLNQLRGNYRSAFSRGGLKGLMRFMDRHIRKRQQQLG